MRVHSSAFKPRLLAEVACLVKTTSYLIIEHVVRGGITTQVTQVVVGPTMMIQPLQLIFILLKYDC